MPDHLVLRTVYLPKNEDDKLRALAFERQTSKNDIIRKFVSEGLKAERETSKGGEGRGDVAVPARKRSVARDRD